MCPAAQTPREAESVVSITNSCVQQILPKLKRRYDSKQRAVIVDSHVDRHVGIVPIPSPTRDRVAARRVVISLIDRRRSATGDRSWCIAKANVRPGDLYCYRMRLVVL